MIFDKAKLLSVFDATKDAEPMRYTTPPPGPAARDQDAALAAGLKRRTSGRLRPPRA